MNDILKLTDPDQKHEDLIKSLPTFGTNNNGIRKSTSFAKHVRRNLEENTNLTNNEDSVLLKDESPLNQRNRAYKSLEPLPVLKNQGKDGTKGQKYL